DFNHSITATAARDRGTNIQLLLVSGIAARSSIARPLVHVSKSAYLLTWLQKRAVSYAPTSDFPLPWIAIHPSRCGLTRTSLGSTEASIRSSISTSDLFR